MIKFQQADFDLLVTRRLHHGLTIVVVGVALKEDFVDMGSTLFGYLQQFGFASGLCVGNRRFIEVADVVQFVAVQHETVRARPHVAFHNRASDMGNVQITIRRLGASDDMDDSIHHGFDIIVRLRLNHQCSTFHHLVQVGSVKPMRFRCWRFPTAFQPFRTQP